MASPPPPLPPRRRRPPRANQPERAAVPVDAGDGSEDEGGGDHGAGLAASSKFPSLAPPVPGQIPRDSTRFRRLVEISPRVFREANALGFGLLGCAYRLRGAGSIWADSSVGTAPLSGSFRLGYFFEFFGGGF
jgi:hypothetical protein